MQNEQNRQSILIPRESDQLKLLWGVRPNPSYSGDKGFFKTVIKLYCKKESFYICLTTVLGIRSVL